MTDDAERLRSLELVVAAGEPLPAGEFEKLSASSQLSLESKLRGELEQIAGDLGPVALDPLIVHLEGLLAELVAGGAPAAIVSDMRGTIARLKQRQANYN
jgi:hypothetical protein